ncbi:uncharacterized protein LOC134535666 [Bacillus rossius redtenbacheri]|uniref:uncharacterized protein LOC134535666 n=1 Tax=Bacillus rossius redtenbacheri TaxID=93214 RepID=UPI002FDD09D0
MLKRLALLLVLALGVVCLVLPESQSPRSSSGRQGAADRPDSSRSRRQTAAGGRRLGVLRALWQLVFGTASDVVQAFRNITGFIQESNVKPMLQLQGPPPPPTPADAGASTTEPPYRLTRQEALDIIRRNLYGLVRLFRREFRLAINDSYDNARRAGVELRDSLRPRFS